MATFRAAKTVSSLPDPLEPDTLYAVRVGQGFDLYISDSTGLLAFKANIGGDVWAGWKWLSLMVLTKTGITGSATVSGVSGTVTEVTWQGNLAYRFKPSNGSKSLDGFYRSFDAGVLSGLITTRG